MAWELEYWCSDRGARRPPSWPRICPCCNVLSRCRFRTNSWHNGNCSILVLELRNSLVYYCFKYWRCLLHFNRYFNNHGSSSSLKRSFYEDLLCHILFESLLWWNTYQWIYRVKIWINRRIHIWSGWASINQLAWTYSFSIIEIIWKQKTNAFC